MRIRSVVRTLALTAAALGGPTLLTSAANTQTLGSCKDWPFVGDVCEVIEYCWETEDPACDQIGNQPGEKRQQPHGW
jgi:hypothetical protein